MITLHTNRLAIKAYCYRLAAVLLLFTASCKKDYRELDKGNASLQLSTGNSNVVLDQKNDNGDALLLTWTTGTNLGTNRAIGYVLKIDVKGNNFSKAQVEDLGKGVTSRNYTVKELNNMLLTKLNIVPNTAVSLEAKIVATVGDDKAASDSSSVITVSVKAYQPVTATLYLIGDATPKGSDAANATALVADADQAGVFTWQGLLGKGDFKFITTLGQLLPSYNKGADDTHLVLRKLDTEPDNKFAITEAGIYVIKVNLLDATIEVAEAADPPYTRLWMLGDAVPTGWNIDNPSEMRVDSSNLFVFTYNEVLTAGEFKIPVSTGNFGTDYYMPLVNNQPLSEPGVQLVPGGSPDFKWKIVNPGPYKIKLDLQALTIKIAPFTPYTQIWMVGDATPAGWNIDNPTTLTADAGNPYVFTYSGALTVGEFKFPLATGNWGCDYFMPLANGAGTGSVQMKFIPGGIIDNKWKITQAGNYKITINQLYETISIQKQ